jgi:hypothetical protein
MRAVWTRARSDLRRHLRAVIVLSVLIGLTSALALGAAAGAQRTSTAYERFHAAKNAPDYIVFSGKGVAEVLAPNVDFSKVALLPQVEAVHTLAFMIGESLGADGKALFLGHPNLDSNIFGAQTIEGQSLMPWKVLEGRLPDPARSDEVVIGYRKEPDPQAAVGSTIDLRLLKASVTAEELAGGFTLPDPGATLLGPPIPVKVVGKVFVAGNNELSGSNLDIFVTPAFVQRYRSSSLSAEFALVTLRNGQADTPAFEKGFSAIYPNGNTASSEDEVAGLRRAVNVRVVTLWLFALLTTVVGFMIFGQALSRMNFTESTENPILSALGMTRRQLFAVAMMRAALIGSAAGVVALVVAVAASGLFPTGLARIVEPAPGTNVAALVIGGALLVALGVLLLSVVPALRAARTRGDARGVALVAEFRRPSALAGFVARSGLPASAATGVRLALEPGRGRTTVPVRSAIVGLTLAVVALTAAFGFSASFHHLVETPRLYGQFFDFGGGYPFAGGFDEAIAAMVADPGLSDVMVGNFREAVDVQGPRGSASVNVWAMETLKGSITPTIAAGVWPVNEGEVALGGKTMRQVGARIGDTVQVRAGDTVVPLKVVGKAIFPGYGFGPGLAEGAGMTFSQLQAFFPKDERNLFTANLAPGANAAAVSARLNPKFEPLGTQVGDLEAAANAGFSTTGMVDALGGAQRVPLALSGLLALAAVGTLVHTLVTSIRRRRRDLAVLKTLGFVRRQISATVAWQASTMAGIALLIGLPLGVAVGRWAWTLFANTIGALPVPIVDLPPLLLAVPVTLLLANLIALIPGRLAAATRPAAVFRAE